MFVMQKTYQDNRTGRYIGMTVSYMMKGLSISRRTVQRSLTLLETLGYFRCEVAKGDQSRMCIGLIVHLLTPLFAKHHKEKWPKRRRNPEASPMPQKQIQFYKKIYRASEVYLVSLGRFDVPTRLRMLHLERRKTLQSGNRKKGNK